VQVKLAAMGLLCALVTACGGDGDGGSNSAPDRIVPPKTLAPEGRWIAKGTDKDTTLVVLENGDIWGYATYPNGEVATIHGDAAATGSLLTGKLTLLKYGLLGLSATDFNAEIVEKESLTIVGPSSFASQGTYDQTYDAAPSPELLAGAYSGVSTRMRRLGPESISLSSSSGQTVNISATGELAVDTGAGCVASGSALPRATGKDVFDVNFTFQGANCVPSTGTVFSGIATLEASTGLMVLQTLDNTKAEGFSFHARK